MKKKKILFLIPLLIIFFWIWKDYKKIDLYFINQNKITYSSKNLNSNLLKKINYSYNRFLENFLVSYSNKHKNYWNIQDNKDREKNLEFKFLKNNNNFTISNGNNLSNSSDLPRSHGNNYSNRFSELKIINNTNANNLEVAWIFEMDSHKGDIQANPIVVDGIIYTPIAGGYIVAINGKTGNYYGNLNNLAHQLQGEVLYFGGVLKKTIVELYSQIEKD